MVPAGSGGRPKLTAAVRRILIAQAARGAVYGLGSIVIGVSLEQSGLSTTEVGIVFTAMLAHRSSSAAVKIVYDVGLCALFRRASIPGD